MLTYEDVVQLFPNKKRFIDPSIHFHTVSAYARYSHAKGIFIPLYHDSGELQEAIANGASVVYYRGSPTVEVETSGEGVVRKE